MATTSATFANTGSRFPASILRATPRNATKTATSGFSGRVDDVIKVAGHRLSSMEIESALVSHASVAEAAVVARPDEIKGEAIVCFVTLRSGQSAFRQFAQDELMEHVPTTIGTIARPDGRSLLRHAPEDAQRQDHAPPAARTGAQRRNLGRHHDPRRHERNRADCESSGPGRGMTFSINLQQIAANNSR